jgi:predicted CoA-binding protein
VKTLVIGASANTERISNQLIRRLRNSGLEVHAMGRSNGSIADVPIKSSWPGKGEIHTASIYINPQWQTESWQSHLMEIQPKRVIFNPGTENHQFAKKLQDKGIEVLNACTLVMISTGQF